MKQFSNKTINRFTAISPFSQKNLVGFRKIGRWLFLLLVFILMSLPLFTTFNEMLTKVVELTGVYKALTYYVVPFETRAVSLVLWPLGIESKPTITHLYIERNGATTGIFFSWNCLGWQSGVLLVLTLITGLTGKHKISSKIETILLGITGTFLINLFRISTVVVIAFYFGQLPATLIHDYGGTLFTIAWFFFYWWFSYNFILGDSK